MVQNGDIGARVDNARDRIQLRKDIPIACCVLPALEAGSELAVRKQLVDVVRACKLLRHIHDGTLKRHLTMVICRVFGDITSQLRDLNLLGQSSLEDCIQDFACARLETVHQAWYTPLAVML